MQTITFWRQPQTWKRIDSDGSKHVSHESAFAEMQSLVEAGWILLEFNHTHAGIPRKIEMRSN